MSPVARPRFTTLALVAFALALGGLLFVALSPGSSGTPASASAAATTIKIDIKDYAFSKKSVTVKVGQKVKWTNRDSVKHNVTPNGTGAGAPKGPLLAKGKSYTWKATKKGIFKYHCAPHPYMQATVTVK